MHIANDKTLINVLNAAVTSNHQQVKSQLNSLIAKVLLIPNVNQSSIDDLVADLVGQIEDIDHKLNDVTDYIKFMKVSAEE